MSPLDTEQWVQAYWTNAAKVNLSCPRLKQLFYININREAMDGIPSSLLLAHFDLCTDWIFI